MLVAPYRNPFLAARALATLSEMSKGRTVATLGTGYLREEFDALGACYDDRLTDEEGYLRAMRLAWTGEPVHARGNGWTAVGNSMYPRPWEDKEVPLWRGGNTMKAIRHVAANYDGWSPTGSTSGVAQQINSAPMSLKTLGPKAARLLELWNENDRAGKPDICWSDGDLSWLSSEDAIESRIAMLSRMGVTWLKVKLSGRTTDEKIDSLHHLGEALASANVLDEPPRARPAQTADRSRQEAAAPPRCRRQVKTNGGVSGWWHRVGNRLV